MEEHSLKFKVQIKCKDFLYCRQEPASTQNSSLKYHQQPDSMGSLNLSLYLQFQNSPQKVLFNLEPRGENGKLGLDSTSLVLNLVLMTNGASWAVLWIACSGSETLLVGWHCPGQLHPHNPSSSGFPKNQFQENLWSLTVFFLRGGGCCCYFSVTIAASKAPHSEVGLSDEKHTRCSSVKLMNAECSRPLQSYGQSHLFL